MKAVAGALIAVLAAVLPSGHTAVRLHGPAAPAAAAPAATKRAPHRPNTTEVAPPPGAAASVPVFAVEVPVVQVVVVDDGGAGVGGPGQDPGSAAGLPSLDASCQEEMQRMAQNKTRVQSAMVCEKETGHSKRAIESLQGADVQGASNATARMFLECGGLTRGCAGQVADRVVLTMRLSGVSVSEHCSEVVQSLQSERTAQNETTVACERQAMKALVVELQQRDLEGAMTAAQHGLAECHHVEAPCDFQLAPLMVAQIVMAITAQQEMTQVLLGGIRAAEEMAGEVEAVAATTNRTAQGLRGTTNRTERGSHEKAVKAKTTAHKALSLLGVAGRLRLASTSRAVQL